MNESHEHEVGIAFAVDTCLFFDNGEEKNGTLFLTGWCYDSAGSEKITIEVRNKGSWIGFLDHNEDREDVKGVHADAPVKCGFSTGLRCSCKLETGGRVEIIFSKGDEFLQVEKEVININDRLRSNLDGLGLSLLKKSKLNNLILNESERLNHAVRLKSSPFYLILDPCWACNLSCLYCHGDVLRKAGYSPKMLEWNLFEKIMIRYGEKLIAVYFANWGEPFLNKNIFGYIRKMKELEIHVTTSTNFNIIFSDEDIDEMVRSGLDHIIVSIDGAKQETYEKYRRGGSLSRVLDNARRIIDRRVALNIETPRLRWQYLLFEWNRDEVDKAREMAGKIGFDEFIVRRSYVFDSYEPMLQKRDPGVMDQINPEYRNLLMNYYQDKVKNNHYYGCDHLYRQMSINSDGVVHPCCYIFEPGHSFGDIDSDEDVMNSDYHCHSRAMFLKPPESVEKGYDPCLNCWIMTAEWNEGHVKTAFNFINAVNLVLGENFDKLISD